MFGHYAFIAVVAAYFCYRISRLTPVYGRVISSLVFVSVLAIAIYVKLVGGDVQNILIKYISYILMAVLLMLVACDMVRRGWFTRGGPNDFWLVEKILFAAFLLAVLALSIQTGGISGPPAFTGIVK